MSRAKSVTDDGILTALADIAGSKRMGQVLDPARHHPFPARMPLALADHLISRLTTPNAIILDPMVGSGTTVVAGKRLGRKCIGFDRDPLACLIARTAVNVYRRADLELLRDRVFRRAKQIARSVSVPDHRTLLPEEDQVFLKYWFPSHCQRQLFALSLALREERTISWRELAAVVLSTLIIAKAAGASYAMDISRSRPHKQLDKPLVTPFDGWVPRFNAIIKRLPFVDAASTGSADVRTGDARVLPLDDRSVDFILTSPPYLSAIDYLRAHKFSLIWMGHDLETLRELRGTMIGTERGLYQLDGLPESVEARVTDRIQGLQRRGYVRQYLSDLGKVLREAARVLRDDGVAVLVVGPTIINAKRTDVCDLLSPVAQQHGLRVVGAEAREIAELRRSLPPPSHAKSDALAARMRREILLAVRKSP
jgi:DNA modification methylase